MALSGAGATTSAQSMVSGVGDAVKAYRQNEMTVKGMRPGNGEKGGTDTGLFLPDEFYDKHLPSQVAPGTKYLAKYDEFGYVKQIKMYDDYGREIGWVDYTNHGYGDINSPDYHTVPHWHERIYNSQYRDGMKINHRTDINTPLGDK